MFIDLPSQMLVSVINHIYACRKTKGENAEVLMDVHRWMLFSPFFSVYLPLLVIVNRA